MLEGGRGRAHSALISSGPQPWKGNTSNGCSFPSHAKQFSQTVLAKLPHVIMETPRLCWAPGCITLVTKLSFQDSDWLKSSKNRFFFLTLLALWPCLFLVNGSVGGPYCLLIEATLEPHSVRCGWWACPKARFSSSPGLLERCLHVLPVHLCVSGRGVGGIHVSGLGLSRYQNFSIRYQYMWISTILDTYPIRWQNLKTEPMYFKKNSF